MAKSKLDTLNKRLNEVKDAYNNLKKSGLNEEMLQIYLMYKCKISMKKAKMIIEQTDLFYKTIVSNEVLDQL